MKRYLTRATAPVLLALIVLIGAVLRFYRLGDVPAGFHRDEAFLGYNAYSILRTGSDMTGNFLPIHIPSFLYCPGGYSYLSIIPIALFGLSAFSVRFASAFFGTLTVPVTFFLIRELYAGIKRDRKYAADIPGLIAALLLAVTPWHITLSRTATENTIVVFFVAVGVLCYSRFVRTGRIGILILSFASFALTLAVYQAPRAFLPLFIPLLVLAHIRTLTKKQVLLSAGAFFVSVLLPLAMILLSPTLATRIRTVSLFATPGTQLVIDEFIREDGTVPNNAAVTRLIHNKPVAYAMQGIRNYFAHWSYDFLFTDEILPMRYRVPSASILYLGELPLLVAGIIYLLTTPGPMSVIILGWILLAPVGSSLTFDDVPNIQRTLIVFPALSIASAFGAVYLFSYLKRIRSILPYAALSVIVAVFAYNALTYLHAYYVQQFVHRPWYRHEGYSDLVTTVNGLLADTSGYTRAVVTNSESAPTIFFLFYGRYSPAAFQDEIRSSAFTSYDRIGFSKYTFSLEECPFKEYEETDKVTGEKRTLSNGMPGTVYVNYGTCPVPKTTGKLIRTVKRSDGTPVFHVIVPAVN